MSLPRRRFGNTRNSSCDRTRTFILVCGAQLWRRPGCLLYRKLQSRGRNSIELHNLYVLCQHSCNSAMVLIVVYRRADCWCMSSSVQRILLLYLRRSGKWDVSIKRFGDVADAWYDRLGPAWAAATIIRRFDALGSLSLSLFSSLSFSLSSSTLEHHRYIFGLAEPYLCTLTSE